MRLRSYLGFIGLLFVVTASIQASGVRTFSGEEPVEWSRRLASSELGRRGETLFPGGGPKSRWDYTTGYFARTLQKLGTRTGEDRFTQAGNRIVSSFISPEGKIGTYHFDEYNIDNVTPGRALLAAYEADPRPEWKTALETLRRQLAEQPRTSEGGFWHKLRYPYQMWLDGLFMGSPFYARYGKVFGEPAAFDDVAKQILLIDRHLYDEKTGLYYHAWDEKRSQGWADKTTGRSPHFWGRAVGWFGMAVVDVLDDMPPTQPDVEAVNHVLRKIADGIARWQDPQSGLWWQVLDQGNREGNYLEATASSMYVYILAKGINQGYLPREKFEPVVLKAYEAIVRDLLRKDPDGTISLTRCCEVAGLGYTNSAGRSRDGSFEYYISEPVIDNDLKGVSPFIDAGLEVDRMLRTENTVWMARGWSDLARVEAQIKAPTFPDRDFPITEYGAKEGTVATEAFRKAIAACVAAGGGRVVVPKGTWPTGPIHLESGVNLHVAEGATLAFSTVPSDYLPAVLTRWEGVECLNYSPLIYAHGKENVAVTGKGTLDGGAAEENWWAWKKGPQKEPRDRLFAWGEQGRPVAERDMGPDSKLRPSFVQFYQCKNVLVEGVTLLRAPMWVLHPVLSENVTVRGVTVRSHGYNNDGCNPESSRNVLIERCLFDTGDDCIAIKSGRNEDGRRIGRPSENIIVRDCQMKDGHGGVVLGSEISGDVRNIFIERCEMDSPNLDRALRFKSNARRGGVVENVFMRDVAIGKVAEAVLTVDFQYEEGGRGDHRPVVKNVVMERIRSSGSPRVLLLLGIPNGLIDGIRLLDSEFHGLTSPDRIEHVQGVSMVRVQAQPARTSRALNSPTP